MLNLEKGSAIALTKDTGVKKVRVGLGWEFRKSSPLDLDASVFLLTNASGSPVCQKSSHFVFFNNLNGPGVQHMGDNRTGAGEGDDETIIINFADVEKTAENVDEISVFVTIYQARQKNLNFGNLEEAHVNIYNENDGKIIAQYKLHEAYGDKFSLQVGSFVKNAPGDWEFQAIGVGFCQDLGDICQKYTLKG